MNARVLIPLGTASQVPTPTRNHNAFFLRWDDEGFLFDPGEATQRQMTLAGIAASDITRICISHFHGDHCLGLPGVIQRLSLDNVAHVVTIHYPASGQAFFDRLRHASIYAGFDRIEPHPLEGDAADFDCGSVLLRARRLEHTVDAWGFRLEERDTLRVRQELIDAMGIRGKAVGDLLRNGSARVGDRTVRRHDVSEVRAGQVFAFVMDTRPCDGARELARGADLVVCESTYLETEAALAHESGHMTASQAGQLAREAAASTLVLGHFSQRYPDASDFVREAQGHVTHVVAAVEPVHGSPQRIAVPPRAAPRFSGDFEAHITVAVGAEDFARTCDALGVSAVQIELARGSEPVQPMTVSHHRGDLARVRAEVDGLAVRLQEAGFTVVRRKIEAHPEARGVPRLDDDALGLPTSCYFEVHLKVRVDDVDLAALTATASAHGGHVSANARTRSGTPERFVTIRVPRAGRETAEARVAALRSGLSSIVDEVWEFTVYDSNLELDRGWLST